MMILLIPLAIAALVGVVGTLVVLRRDGYRALPTRPDHEFTARRDAQAGREASYS